MKAFTGVVETIRHASDTRDSSRILRGKTNKETRKRKYTQQLDNVWKQEIKKPSCFLSIIPSCALPFRHGGWCYIHRVLYSYTFRCCVDRKANSEIIWSGLKERRRSKNGIMSKVSHMKGISRRRRTEIIENLQHTNEANFLDHRVQYAVHIWPSRLPKDWPRQKYPKEGRRPFLQHLSPRHFVQ